METEKKRQRQLDRHVYGLTEKREMVEEVKGPAQSEMEETAKQTKQSNLPEIATDYCSDYHI